MGSEAVVKGKIIRAISGFFYVQSKENVWTCKAKGVFRSVKLKPIVGDDVEFEIVDEGRKEGNLSSVLKRRNILIRPEVSNVDQAMVVFALRDPDPNMNLLDRFLIHMGQQSIPVILFLNKSDLDQAGLGAAYQSIYENAGCDVIVGSNGDAETMFKVRERLQGKTTVLAGPSGVGKSSLLLQLDASANAKVGELSAKIRRGKQTTRHSELFTIGPDTYLLDTPGFTSLYVQKLASKDLQLYYREFDPYVPDCRFTGCSHISEPPEYCRVKRAVEEGSIPRLRYDNYVQIYHEIKETERRH